jgi:hypothetical protein
MLPLLVPALIAGGATLLSGIIQGASASSAAATQAGAAQAGIDEQKRQNEATMAALAPYTKAGVGAMGRLSQYEEAGGQGLAGQLALAGLSGADAQQAAINSLNQSPEMLAMTQQGESAIRQNAAATGGLRGGNIQGALAQFRPQLLSSLINQQYSRLGGLTALGQGTATNIAQLGQSAAAGQASGALQTGQNIAGLLQQQGASVAGGQLAQGQAWQNVPNAFMTGLGTYAGLGGKF